MGREARIKMERLQAGQKRLSPAVEVILSAASVIQRGFFGRFKWLLFGK